MTDLVAKAHAQTFELVKPKMFSHFTKLGYLYTTPAHAICPPPLAPFSYKFERVDDVATKFRDTILQKEDAAAKEKAAKASQEKAKQTSLKAFFKPK
jgi:hypothetical protein